MNNRAADFQRPRGHREGPEDVETSPPAICWRERRGRLPGNDSSGDESANWKGVPPPVDAAVELFVRREGRALGEVRRRCWALVLVQEVFRNLPCDLGVRTVSICFGARTLVLLRSSSDNVLLSEVTSQFYRGTRSEDRRKGPILRAYAEVRGYF